MPLLSVAVKEAGREFQKAPGSVACGYRGDVVRTEETAWALCGQRFRSNMGLG